MASSKRRDPSPIRAIFFHGFLSLLVFGGVSALIGFGVHMTGNPADAGPNHIVALFERNPQTVRTARAQLVDERAPALAPLRNTASLGQAEPEQAETERAQPNLGVADPGGSSGPVRRAAATSDARPAGMTINGVFVPAGKSYRQVEEGSTKDPVTRLASGPQSETEAVGSADAAAARISISTPSTRNARPFDNPEGKPVVALIVGGLGTSARQTYAAIDALPPDVTLSFIADASPRMIRRAREKGHEVLLEVPMEPYERGRTLPHSQTLLAAGSAEDNQARLDQLLSRGNDFYGVINHHGEKFADADGALQPVFERLQARGLAFFRHGSTPSRSFDVAAGQQDVLYAAASENIDNQVTAEAIERRLQQLENTALNDGAALGTGYFYPLTMDIIASWSERLEAKGILLAPASVVAAASSPRIQTTQLATPETAR